MMFGGAYFGVSRRRLECLRPSGGTSRYNCVFWIVKRLRMSFRSVFMAVVIAFALILAAFLINRARPQVETEQPSADLVRATGKCAECHARAQYSVVHEYEMSAHARKGVNCLDCHQPADGQQKQDHHG